MAAQHSSRKTSSSPPPPADSDTEATPLLTDGSAHVKVTPLPLTQLLVLATVRLAEPISFSQIFPYVNQMIEYLGIAEPADVGYYSGLVDSAFSLVQALTIYFWSSLSDRIGRKPVVLIGVIGAALSSACFGLSRSLTTLMISRCLAGALSGNIAVMSTMLTEMTDETNQAKAFPLMSATWYIGSIIGPVLGGSLSNPATKWPEFFSNYPVFKDYPYLLPCLVSSALSILSVILCVVFVKETLPSIVAKKQKKALGADPSEDNRSYGATRTPTDSTAAGPSGSSTPTRVGTDSETEPEHTSQATDTSSKRGKLMTLLSKPHVRALVMSGFVFHFIGVGFEVVFVLYSYTRIKLGGMGRSPAQIGYALAGSGAVGTFMSLAFFPFIQRRFNNRRLYIIFSAFWALGFAVMPIGHLAATIPVGGDESKRGVLVWIAIALILLPIRLAVNVSPLGMVLVKASVDTPEQVSSLFGLQQAFFSIGRGISPAFVSTLFAFSTERQVLHGNFVWVVLFLIGLTGIPLAMKVKNVPAPGVHRKARS